MFQFSGVIEFEFQFLGVAEFVFPNKPKLMLGGLIIINYAEGRWGGEIGVSAVRPVTFGTLQLQLSSPDRASRHGRHRAVEPLGALW